MNFAEFLSMSGYWKFVWGAYGFTFAVLAVNLFFALRGLKKSKSKRSPKAER